MNNPEPGAIAGRMKEAQERQQAIERTQQQERERERDRVRDNRTYERDVLALFDAAVAQINAQLAEPLIRSVVTAKDKEYRFGGRSVHVHFFDDGELYRNPKVPGRMDVLRTRHAVHAGFVEIRENSEDREGWNLVLVRAPRNAGEWRLVETRVSALVPRRTRFEPVATDAQLFADNLACHWHGAMHSFVLTDKALAQDEILRIFDVLVPAAR
jgi:hypothetical protein